MKKLILSIFIVCLQLFSYAQGPKKTANPSKPINPQQKINQAAVTGLIRGQYKITGDIEPSNNYAGSLQARRMILQIDIDDKTKSNACWIQEQVFKQENNPNYIRNGVNLSYNYSWYAVEGSLSTGTYKINASDSTITFTWKKKYQGILPKAKLKFKELDMVLELPNGRYFTKEFDYDNGEFTRSKSRLAQIAVEEKREEEEKLKQRKIREEEQKLRLEKEEEQKKIAKENERRALAEKWRLEQEKKKQQKEEEILKKVLKTTVIGKFEVSGEFEGNLDETKTFLENKLGDGWRFAVEDEIKKLTDFSGMKSNFSSAQYLDLISKAYIVKDENNEFIELYTTENAFGKKINFKPIDLQKVYHTFFVRPVKK